MANQSALFLESRMADAEGGADGADDLAASSVVGVTMQGSRAILVEVQVRVVGWIWSCGFGRCASSEAK